MAKKKASPQRQYWLLKSEPDCFSFDDLWHAPKRRTGWDGVRNYQARNFMRDGMQVGDLVLYYHSSADPAGVAGVARVASAAYPDPTQFDPSEDHFDAKSKRDDPAWLQIDIEALAKFKRFVSLEELRASAGLEKMLLLQRGQRLSVLPVTEPEWRLVVRLGGLSAREFGPGA